jgi:hypothetical protein
MGRFIDVTDLILVLAGIIVVVVVVLLRQSYMTQWITAAVSGGL